MLPYFESAHQNQKSITFTCIRARSSVCYVGKNAILKKKYQFYQHDRHQRKPQGACYAGKSDVRKQKNLTFTCITATWYGSYAGKIDVFF